MTHTLYLRVDTGTHSATITDLAVIDEGLVISAGRDKRVRLWTGEAGVPTGRAIVGQIGPGRDGEILAIAAHPWRRIVAVSVNSALTEGTVIRFMDLMRDAMVTFRWSRPVADLAFSDDGSLLFVAAGPGGSIANGSLADSSATEGRLEVYRLEDLLELPPTIGSEDESSEDESWPAAQFVGPRETPDQDGLLSPGEPWRSAELLGQPANLAVDRPTDDTVRVVVTPKLKDTPQIFDLSADTLAEADLGARALPAVGRAATVAISGRFVAFAGLDSGLTVRDLDRAPSHQDTALERTLAAAGGGRPAGLAFSPDGMLLAVGSRAGAGSEVTIHDVAHGYGIVGARRYDDDALSVAFLDNGTVVSAGGSRFSIEYWDPRTFEDGYHMYRDGAGQVIDAVGIAGNQLGFGHPDPIGLIEESSRPSLARRFDLDLLDLIPSSAEPAQSLSLTEFHRAVHAAPDGHRRLEVENGYLYMEPGGLPLTGNGRFPGSPVTSYGLLPGGSVVFGETSGTVRVLGTDRTDNPGGRKLVGHTSAVLDLAVGNRWIATGGRDQVLRLWFARDAKEADPGSDGLEPALNLFVTAANDWVIWSPTGYYASSLRGDTFITFHHNLGEGKVANSYGAVSFSNHLYRPDIIRKIVETGREDRALAALGVAGLDMADILPPHVLLLQTDGHNEEDLTYELRFEVTEAAYPTTKISIVHNGIPTDELDPEPAEPGQTIQYSVTVFLDEEGMNEFSVIAENEVARSTPATMVDETSSVDSQAAPDVGFSWHYTGGHGDGDETDDADLAMADLQLGDPILATVRSGEIVIRIDARPQDADVTLSATRNYTEVWRAEARPGAGFEAEVTIPLESGTNDIQIWAEAEHGATQLADASLHLPVWVAVDDPGQDPDETVISHEVRSGDTLQRIAKRYYGDPGKYPLIFDANRGQLLDPDRIDVGMVLLIPQLTTVAGDDEGEGGTGGAVKGDTGGAVDGHEIDEGDGEVDLQDGDGGGFEYGSGLGFESRPLDGGGRKGSTERGSSMPPPSDPTERNLYMLSIGVSGLQRTDHGLPSLRYSGLDAAAMADRFKQCETTEFRAVHQVGMSSQNFVGGRDATKANIDRAVDELVDTVRVRAAEKSAAEKQTKQKSATDVTVLFFSGHGIGRSSGDGEPEGLYLIPYDYDENNWETTAVSVVDIAEKFATLQRTELIIFIDACRSGFAGSDVVGRINPQQLHKRLERATLGTIYVLSSTTRDLDSFEYRLRYPYDKTKPDRKFRGHGLFTHAILKSMDVADETGSSLTVLGLGDAVQGQFATWRTWKTFVEHGMRQDPWYEFDRGFRRLEIYKR